jgi:anti-sigma factor RsiW
MTELSDELLVAYVDRQLAHKQSRAVEKVLAQDDVIARRVAALKKAHRRLEAAFDALLAGEEADAVSHPVPPSPGLLTVAHGRRARRRGSRRWLVHCRIGWPLAHCVRPADTDYVGACRGLA